LPENRQTALGKTSTYLNYMKDSVRPVVIAVPTHELKQQIFYDANLHGIEAICATPDIATYGISGLSFPICCSVSARNRSAYAPAPMS